MMDVFEFKKCCEKICGEWGEKKQKKKNVVCVVSCVTESDGETVYKLKGKGDVLYSRTQLGLRKWISVAHISISDDKKHDAAHVGAYFIRCD